MELKGKINLQNTLKTILFIRINNYKFAIILSLGIHLAFIVNNNSNKDINSHATIAFQNKQLQIVSIKNAKASQPKKNKSFQTVLTKDFDKAVLQNIHPIYPRIALKKSWSGKVILHLFINPDGSVKHVKVLQSSKYDVLDNSALIAASQWIFKKSQSGKPYQIKKEVVFKIKNS